MSGPGKWSIDQTVRRRLVAAVRQVLETAGGREQALQQICTLLATEVPHYHWVGFYLVDPARPNELVLGPFVGAPTEHVRIPFGRGICGQSAARQATVLVQDVSAEANYLACSAATRAELVVPVFAGGTMVGQIDVDSHEPAPFDAGDRELLEAIGARVGEQWSRWS
jgi:GAF domain-containing protein